MKFKILWTVVTILFAGFGVSKSKYTGSRTELDKRNEIYQPEIPAESLTDNYGLDVLPSTRELEPLNLTDISAEVELSSADNYEDQNRNLGLAVPESDDKTNSQIDTIANDQIIENLNSPTEITLRNIEIIQKDNEITLKDNDSSQTDTFIDEKIIANPNIPPEITLRGNQTSLKDNEIAINENESEINYEKNLNDEILSESHPSHNDADPAVETFSPVTNSQDTDSEFDSNVKNMDGPSTDVNLSLNEIWRTSPLSDITEMIPTNLGESLTIFNSGNDTNYVQLETSTLQSEMVADNISRQKQDYQIDSTEKNLRSEMELQSKASTDTEKSIKIDNQSNLSKAAHVQSQSEKDQEIKSQGGVINAAADLAPPVETEVNYDQNEIEKDLDNVSEAQEILSVPQKEAEPIEATTVLNINLGSVITSVQGTENSQDTPVNNEVVEPLAANTTVVYEDSTALPQERFTKAPKATDINTFGVTNLQDDLISSDDTTLQPIPIHKYIVKTLENTNVTTQLSGNNRIETATEYNEPMTVKFSVETSLSPTSSSDLESKEFPNTDNNSFLNELDYKMDEISKDGTQRTLTEVDVDPLNEEIANALKLSPPNEEISNVKSVSKIEQASAEKAVIDAPVTKTFEISDTEEEVKELLKKDLSEASETRENQNEDTNLNNFLKERGVETATESSESITVLSSKTSDIAPIDSSGPESTESRNALIESSSTEYDPKTGSLSQAAEDTPIKNAIDNLNEEIIEKLETRSQNEESLNLDVSEEKLESSELEAFEGIVKIPAKEQIEHPNEETSETINPTSRNEETQNLEILSKEEQESVEKDAIEGLVKQTIEILDIEKEVEELLQKELEETNEPEEHQKAVNNSTEYTEERSSETQNTTLSHEEVKQRAEAVKNSVVDITIDPLTLTLLETKILDDIIKEVSNADLTLTPVSSFTNLDANVPEEKSAEQLESFTANVVDTVTQSSLKITTLDEVNKFEDNVKKSEATTVDAMKADLEPVSVPEILKEILSKEINHQPGSDEINTVNAEEVLPDTVTVESISLGAIEKSLEESTSEIDAAIFESTEANAPKISENIEVPLDAQVPSGNEKHSGKDLVLDSQPKDQIRPAAEAIAPSKNDQSMLQTAKTKASNSEIPTNISNYSISIFENNLELGSKSLNTAVSPEKNSFEDDVLVTDDTTPETVQMHTYNVKSLKNTNLTSQIFGNDQTENSAENNEPITALFSKDSSLSAIGSPMLETNKSPDTESDSSPNKADYKKANISQRTLSKTTIDRPIEKGVETIKSVPQNEETSNVKSLSNMEQDSSEKAAIEELVNQAFGILDIEKEVKELLKQDLEAANQTKENQKLDISSSDAGIHPEGLENKNLDAAVLPSPENLVENFVEEVLEDIEISQTLEKIVENSLEKALSNATVNEIVSKISAITKSAHVSDIPNQTSSKEIKSSEEEIKDDSLPESKSVQVSDLPNPTSNKELKSSEEQINDVILSQITNALQNATFTVVLTEQKPEVTAINPNASSFSPVTVQSEISDMDSLANISKVDHPSQPISDPVAQPKSDVTRPRDVQPPDAAIEDLIEQVIETLNAPEEVEELLEREIEESFNPAPKTESQEIEEKSQENPVELEFSNLNLKQNEITSNAEVNDILISNEIINSGGDIVGLQSLSAYAPTDLRDETEGGTFGHVLPFNTSVVDAKDAISEASSGIVSGKNNEPVAQPEDLVADVNPENSPGFDIHQVDKVVKNNAVSEGVINKDLASSSSNAEQVATPQTQIEVEETRAGITHNQHEAVSRQKEITPDITRPHGPMPLEISLNLTQINEELKNNPHEHLNKYPLSAENSEHTVNLNTKVSGLEEASAQIATEVKTDAAIPGPTNAASNDVAVLAEKLDATTDKAEEKLNEFNTTEPLSSEVMVNLDTVSQIQPQSELGNPVHQVTDFIVQIKDPSYLSHFKEEPNDPKLSPEHVSINFENQSSLLNPVQKETVDNNSNDSPDKLDQPNVSSEEDRSEVETTLDDVPRKILTSSISGSEEQDNFENESPDLDSSKTPVQNSQSEIKEKIDKPLSLDISTEIDDPSSKEKVDDDSSEQAESIVRQDESAEESSSEGRYYKPHSPSIEDVSKESEPLEDTNDQKSSESSLSNAAKFFLENKVKEGIAPEPSTPKGTQMELSKIVDQEQAAVILQSPETNERALHLSEIDESPMRKVYQPPIYQGRSMLSEELIVPQSLQLAADFVPTKVEFDSVGLETVKDNSSLAQPTGGTVKKSDRSFDDSQLNREDSTNNFMDAVVEAAELTTEMNRFIWTFHSSVAPNQEIPVSRPPSPRAAIGAKLVEPRSITTSSEPYQQVASLNLTVIIAVSVTALFLLLALLLVLGNKIRSQNGTLNIELAEQQMNSHVTVPVPVTEDS